MKCSSKKFSFLGKLATNTLFWGNEIKKLAEAKTPTTLIKCWIFVSDIDLQPIWFEFKAQAFRFHDSQQKQLMFIECIFLPFSLFFFFFFGVPHLATFISSIILDNVIALASLSSIQYTVSGFEPTISWLGAVYLNH